MENLLRLTSFPQGRTEQCCELPSRRAKLSGVVRFTPRGTRKQKRHSLGVHTTRGKFAPSYKLPTGKDGAMLRTPIPRSKALGSSSIRSTRRQKTKKTLTWSEYDPWEICSVLQASHREGRSNVANSHPEEQALGSSSIHSTRRQKTKKTLAWSVFFVLVTRGRIELPFQP